MISFEEAVEYMKYKHGDQLRKQGTPYYTHPLEVAYMLREKGLDEEYQIAGLFHDLLEDTDTTYQEILYMTNDNVAEAVRLVTKEEGYDVEQYYDRIERNNIARMVKLADRIHNLSEILSTDRAFIDKYLAETKKYFYKLAKGTIFEGDLCDIIQYVENGIKK